MEMKTIDELMEGQEPGSIKIRLNTWMSEQYFIPYFKAGRTGRWYGLDERGGRYSYSRSSRPDWHIYEPPKTKVKMWQWLIKGSDGTYYLSVHSQSVNIFDGYTVIKRLDHTEIEVETEESI
jgi:hypothetical protein